MVLINKSTFLFWKMYHFYNTLVKKHVTPTICFLSESIFLVSLKVTKPQLICLSPAIHICTQRSQKTEFNSSLLQNLNHLLIQPNELN